MSALAGTKNSYVTLVIVKFSHFIRVWVLSQNGILRFCLLERTRSRSRCFPVEVSDVKIMSNAKSRRYFHYKLQQGDHETWVV